MNSPMEEILEFKTCCGLRMLDQNLEIHVRNQGDVPVVVRSCFDLNGERWSRRVETVMPPGEHMLEAGEIMAFYCQMDEALWKKANEVVFHDTAGGCHAVTIRHENE